MRKNNRRKIKIYGEVKVYDEIIVTRHAIERHKERGLIDDTEESVRQDIINKVRTSRLFKIKGKEEHRENCGYLFVCKREFRNGLPVITVVTELLTVPRKLENFGKRYV